LWAGLPGPLVPGHDDPLSPKANHGRAHLWGRTLPALWSDGSLALMGGVALEVPGRGGNVAEASGGEFWRDLKPIEHAFKPGALPEAYISQAATDDERYYAPLSETVGTRPLWISPGQNRWCDVLMCRGAGMVNRHYHPQQVFAYTISGKWGYLEHDWVATAGDWIYEAPGEAHTLVAYESPEPMRVTFNVTGPLIWLDENGQPEGHFDVFVYIELCKNHYEKVGIGADYIDRLFR
jgi:2,4'-dihydroxyacetophenone dioxygenase